MRDKAHAILFDEHSALKPLDAPDMNDQSAENAHPHPSVSDKLTTDEILLLRGVAHFSPETINIRRKKQDGNNSIAAPSSEQAIQPPNPSSSSAPTASLSPNSSEYRTAPSEARHEPVIVSPNLFQDVIMAQLAEGGSAGQVVDESLLRLGIPKGHLQAGTALPVLSPPGDPYRQDTLAWTQINSFPGSQLPQPESFQAGNTLNPSSSTTSNDHNSPLFRSSELSSTNLDSIMSYPITLTPSVEPSATYSGTGRFVSMGPGVNFAGDDGVDWNSLMRMTGLTSGSAGSEPVMEWEGHTDFSR